MKSSKWMYGGHLTWGQLGSFILLSCVYTVSSQTSNYIHPEKCSDEQIKKEKFENTNILTYSILICILKCIIIKLMSSVVFGIRLIVHALEHFIKVLTRRTHAVQNTIAFVRVLQTVPIVIIKINWRTIMVIVRSFRNNFKYYPYTNHALLKRYIKWETV